MEIEKKVIDWVMSKEQIGTTFNLSLTPLELISLHGIIILVQKHLVFRITKVLGISETLLQYINDILKEEGFTKKEVDYLNTKEIDYDESGNKSEDQCFGDCNDCNDEYCPATNEIENN